MSGPGRPNLRDFTARAPSAGIVQNHYAIPLLSAKDLSSALLLFGFAPLRLCSSLIPPTPDETAAKHRASLGVESKSARALARSREGPSAAVRGEP
jgi:hypothetical protein